MVKTGYMLDQPKPADAVRRFVDQRLFPVAIDAAAGIEGALERLRIGVQKRPVFLLGAAFVYGAGASLIVRSIAQRDRR